MIHKAVYSVNLQISPEEAWDKLRDLSLAPHYVPGVKSMEYITRQKEGVGTARLVFPQHLKEEVVLWEAGREILLKLTKRRKDSFFPFKNSFFRYTVLQTGGTFMKLSLEYNPQLGRLGYLLFRGIIQKRIEKTAASLKEFYEA